MYRLTQKDEQGNWCLKGQPWAQLHVGQTITPEAWEKLYGALWKLMEYEDTGLTPDEVEGMKRFEGSNTEKYLAEKARHRWLPVEERIPEEREVVLACDNNGGITLALVTATILLMPGCRCRSRTYRKLYGKLGQKLE